MSSSNTITASNIGSAVSSDEVKQFFSFCGKISDLKLSKDASGTQTAEVTFEKTSAAKTATLLHQTQLGGKEIHVTAHQDATGAGTTATKEHESEDDGPLSQEDKPRARIAAEYLAHGYKLADSTLQKAIEIDGQKGISKRLMGLLQGLDNKTGASTKALAVDNKYNISGSAVQSAQSAYMGLGSFYERFTGTPAGSKIHSFYLSQQRQVQDIHNEALRLSGLRKDQSGVYPAHTVGEEHGMKKTHCECSGVSGVCGCADNGECTCKGCAKAEGGASMGEKSAVTATGAADKIANNTGIDPLK